VEAPWQGVRQQVRQEPPWQLCDDCGDAYPVGQLEQQPDGSLVCKGCSWQRDCCCRECGEPVEAVGDLCDRCSRLAYQDEREHALREAGLL
jgi:hypothetical protein